MGRQNGWNNQAAAQGAGGPNATRGNSGRLQSPLEELMWRKGVDDAWTALEEMQKQGLSCDRFTVSRMLMKTVEDGRSRPNPAKIHRAIAVVERFIQYQPEEADEVLFNALLDTCCRIKELNRLDATLQRMRELRVEPSHVTLGILVKAYGQAGDISRVLQIWEDMESQRRQANAVTYGCMIDACIKCGHMEKAMEIFYDMKRRRKHRNTILYTTLIKGCGLEKDLTTALTLFREMRAEGVPCNTITYNSIVDVCIKCGDVQAAEELLREMLNSGTIQPDLITYSTLLKGYCQTGDLDKALQVVETTKACGFKCDELVYNTLMDGCVKANDLSAGIGLLAEMIQAGLKPSSITHSILVRLYQRHGFKDDCYEAVTLLYQHHGLDKPNGSFERSGKAGGGGRRGDRTRHGQSHGRGSYANGGPQQASGGHQSSVISIDAGLSECWNHHGGPMPAPAYNQGVLPMAPQMTNQQVGAPPQQYAPVPDHSFPPAWSHSDSAFANGMQPPYMPTEPSANQVMPLYMPPSPSAWPVPPGSPPCSWNMSSTAPQSGAATMSPPQLPAGAVAHGSGGAHCLLPTSPQKLPCGRTVDVYPDASPMRAPTPHLGGMGLMPGVPAWPQGIQCGGPGAFGE